MVVDLQKARREGALVSAMTLIRHGWTQGAFARDRAGTACAPDSPQVKRMDLACALSRAAIGHGLPEDDLRPLVLAQLGPPWWNDQDYGIERWNDKPYRTRTEVIIVLERTINAL